MNENMSNYVHDSSLHDHISKISTTSTVDATDKCLSTVEDYRRGAYYIKHAHNCDNTGIVFLVYKDNPAPDKNWRGNQILYMYTANDGKDPSFAYSNCIDWISRRRCFKNN